nr:uncharacterized protein LOC116774364 isoform X2 [Danaus plexippus plexippus]
MMNYSFRYYNHIRQFNSGVLALTNKSNIGNSRNYAQDKGGCKETPQHEGKRVESWPKPDPPPPAWRCECPWEPQPPNYDPYRIKVPDIAVPPLPPSNAKWTGLVLMTQAGQEGQGYQNQHHQHGQYNPYGQQYGQSGQEEAEREEESQGFFGYLKSLFGRGKKGKGEGEASMIGQKICLSLDLMSR